jgi:hypothetical protein
MILIHCGDLSSDFHFFFPAVQLNVAWHRWSRYGEYCDQLIDGTGHGVISTGNRKPVPRYDEFLSYGGEYVEK